MDGLLTAKDAVLIMFEVVKRLRTLHTTGFIHGEVHPGNVMISTFENVVFADGQPLFLIDFGNAKPYFQAAGTPRLPRRTQRTSAYNDFMSTNMHRGYPPSPKDDLESALYIMVFVFNGRLPWSGCRTVREVVQRKDSIQNRALTRGFPNAITWLSGHIRSMPWDRIPPYDLLLSRLRSALHELPSSGNNVFSWETYNTRTSGRRT